MPFIAVVKVENEIPVKFQEFQKKADADAHVAEYGGFVAADPPGNSFNWKVKAGENRITKEDRPERVERSVSRYQFMVALAAEGELGAVTQAMLSEEPGVAPSTEVMLYWLESGTFHRNSDMVKFFETPQFNAIADVDKIFRTAGKVRQ